MPSFILHLLATYSLIAVPCVAIVLMPNLNHAFMFMMQIVTIWPIVHEFTDEKWLVDMFSMKKDPLLPNIIEFYAWAKKWTIILVLLIILNLGYNFLGYWMALIVVLVYFVIVILNEMGNILNMMDEEH